MANYVFPAIFTKEENAYSVAFPDFEGCYTCGDNLEDAIYMAKDVLALTIFDYEKEGKEIPSPSDNIVTGEGSIVRDIECDTSEYWKKNA